MCNLILGDCLEVMAALDENSVDGIVTDPPYGLQFMGKDWDRGIPGVHFWQEAIRVAKPGAHLLAFGGTRTFHRLACAIEDAGWEIRDTVMWVYGQGFPKSFNVSKAIDAHILRGGSNTRKLKQVNESDREFIAKRKGTGLNNGIMSRELRERADITAPATEAARQWDGWGTALKPAVENIIVARKPIDNSGEQDIIVGNLRKLEARLWLLLPANIVALNSKSSPNGYEEVFAIAQWSVDDPRNIRDVLCAQMDMSQYEMAINMTLNTVSSWLSTWEEALKIGSMFITETVTSPIIDLKTLSCSVLALMPQSIIQAATIQPGSWWNVLPAASILNAAAMKLSATLELFAVESAIEEGRIPLPDGIDQDVLSKPIIVARKPLESTVAANVLKWGTGALNIDAGRVPTEIPIASHHGTGRGVAMRGNVNESWPEPYKIGDAGPHNTQSSGRWPANVIHDGSDEVIGLFPQKAGGGYGSTRGVGTANCYGNGKGLYYRKSGKAITGQEIGYGDSGSAARFFYAAKASRAERGNGNGHPTVKPLALMRYLITLIALPGAVILDPFMGSGSTGVACAQLGYDFIGIEIDESYHKIAEARIKDARKQLTFDLE